MAPTDLEALGHVIGAAESLRVEVHKGAKSIYAVPWSLLSSRGHNKQSRLSIFKCCLSQNKVYVYNFADLQLLHQIETSPNPKGMHFNLDVHISPPSRSSTSHLIVYIMMMSL